MPVLVERGGVDEIDYADEGQGRPVVLIHSSVSGNRQWRALTEALSDRYRVLAVNLYGYGETTSWPAVEQQSLAAQAELIRGRVRRARRARADWSATPSAARSRSSPRSCWASAPCASCYSSPIPSTCSSRPGAAMRGARSRACASKCRAASPKATGRGARALRGLLAGRRRMERDAGEAPRRLRRVPAAQRLRMAGRDGRADPDRGLRGGHGAHARRERPRHAPPHPRDRRDPGRGLPGLVVPLPARGRPHGAADAARARQPDRAGVPRRG